MSLNTNKQISKNKKEKNNNSSNIKLELNTSNIKQLLGNSEDIKYREIVLNSDKKISVTLIYIDGLVNSSDISNYVIKPLIQEECIKNAEDSNEVIELIKDGVLYYSAQTIEYDINNVISGIMSGSSALVFDDQNISVVFDAKSFDKRQISEPTVQNATKGAKDCFVENYRSNTATLRRKIKTADLTIENIVIGKQTKTTVAIVYIKSITNDQMIREVKDRLTHINTDNVLSTQVIEESLCENLNNPFPQVICTERPDTFAGEVIEGRVGVLADGIPFGFIVPGTMVQVMQASEDYSHNYMVSTIIRITRYLSLILALTLPSLYIAITTFQPEMIPTNLALFIAKSREGVTFPVAFETILMLIAFEILFEAGQRIPKTVGQAVSIVGTLVVGQAAVEAKLISPAAVVVIAVTSIASFAMPNQDFSNAVRLWRMIFTICSSILGLLGIVAAIILLVFQLSKLETLGVPYLSPYVSGSEKDIIHDTVFRMPIKSNKIRPPDLKVKNVKRRGD